ncbi:MAG: hypothetical protein KJ650_00830, partial [Firmicutes bacterium]|nr:hypothetical protein [Bacillota bacterium]MBV1727315.1 hypothetical protein [Desulforudis sp.]
CDSALKPRDFYRELLYQFGIRPQYLRSEAKTGEIGAGKSAAIRTLREPCSSAGLRIPGTKLTCPTSPSHTRRQPSVPPFSAPVMV